MKEQHNKLPVWLNLSKHGVPLKLVLLLFAYREFFICKKFDEYFKIYSWKTIAFNILFEVWWWNILYPIGGSKWRKSKTWEERNRYESYHSWAVALMVWKVIDILHLIKNIMVTPESHPELSQTSKVELFAKKVNGSKSLIAFASSSISDDWFGSEYAYFVLKKEHFVSISF